LTALAGKEAAVSPEAEESQQAGLLADILGDNEPVLPGAEESQPDGSLADILSDNEPDAEVTEVASGSPEMSALTLP
jgi:hypothetical protein